jgi:hypothetical protein
MRAKLILPEIHVPKFIDAEVKSPGVGLRGFMKWELIRGKDVIASSGGFYPNLITNSGMNGLGVSSLVNMVAFGNVGTAVAAPANTDVALGAEVATARRAANPLSSVYVAGPPEYWYRRNKYIFAETFGNGNLTEFGLWSNLGTFFVRQLLKDGTGTPTVVVKTNLDQLHITHEYRLYPPAADVASVVNVSGVNYDVTTRPSTTTGAAWAGALDAGSSGLISMLAYETNVLAARTSNLAGASVQSGDHTQTPYVADSFYRETKEIWDTGDANFATGIGGFEHYLGGSGLFDSLFLYQSVFNPKLPKTNTKKLTLYFRKYWARYP